MLNVITGGDSLGPLLAAHTGIDKISFTGSTATGRRVMQTAAPTLKRLTLELGGNDAAIVLPDVDVGRVARELFWGAFRNNGQICIAAKRVYIHQSIYDTLTAELVDYARTVRIGDGAELGSQIGPINNRAQYERVLDLIADARERGCAFLLGGEPSPGPGYFVPLTLVDNPPDDARIVREEQFGPVLPLMKFSDLDDVLARANDSQYGLGASIWSADEHVAATVASRLPGRHRVDQRHPISHALGVLRRLEAIRLGVEGGVDGLLEYTVPQTVILRKRVAPPA